MGKEKKDKKKKGKGAEKTAEKTEKKLKLKAKKELAAKGEDDIESMVKAIEEEERKRQEVKEVAVGAPSHRSSFSITAHPDNPEIIFFGGEFYNGQKTTMFNDLLIYNLKRGEWSSIRSPAGPPPRSSHQVSISAHCYCTMCHQTFMFRRWRCLKVGVNCGCLGESSPVQQSLSSTTTRTSGVSTSLLVDGRRLLHRGVLLREVAIVWLPSSGSNCIN